MTYDDDTRRIIRLHDRIRELEAEVERLRVVIKQGRLCDPRYCTFGNENEIDRLRDEIERLRNLRGPK